MGDSEIPVSDVGAHEMWVAKHYSAAVPSTCVISNGFCSMGIGLRSAEHFVRAMNEASAEEERPIASVLSATSSA